ncbi:MAG: D-tyrosyl-tRNA(Tyr) deacylase [Clostridiales bacterium]|nr:D-tyrosyl-tRNA(Tyr) deacylase [Clostridiales bacterium]MCF8021105.1 D-tyrosyl-tRNA(Tyr) deacylase [Clostridiales bacterium]
MRAVIQRVTRSSVQIEGETVSSIGPGAVILLGVGDGDTAKDAEYLAEKIAKLRIFSDESGKMNLSLLDTGNEVLVVSQFTLYADCRKGRRPGFDKAAPPDEGEEYYKVFTNKLKDHGVAVFTGVFRAHMTVEIINDGPVTLLLDSSKQF